MDRAGLEVVAHIADVAEAALWGGVTRDAELFNQRWLAYAGETSEVWIARGWQSAIHDEDRKRCTVAWNETMRHRAIGDIEARLRSSTGQYRWHRIRFVLGDGHWFGIAHDLGERQPGTDTATRNLAGERSARGDAEQASALKDRFFAAVSHELRAPIAALLLWERLLREHDLDPVEKQRALDAIHHSAISQARLVDDLLDVARAGSGKLAVKREPVALAGIVERALEEVRPAAAEKHQDLVVRIEPDFGRVDGDATRLVQILVNLLNNAIKFTPDRGRISLTATRADDQLVVEVADSGRGIDPEFLPHVFDMFSQIDAGLARGEGGLGLGLAIAKELAELHGGTLVADSAGLGAGARFTLRLPPSQLSDSEPLPDPARQLLDGVSVLVVDDDQRVLSALQILLSRAGAETACASSVADALAALDTKAPDVVVSDLAMPGADGYDLVRRMRATAALADIPAIALTAHAALADAERARAEGFDVHLAKPVDLDVLVANIARLAHR